MNARKGPFETIEVFTTIIIARSKVMTASSKIYKFLFSNKVEVYGE
jgi:hypothetical protein